MKACLTFAFALLLVCSGAALAQTPDGTPPSQETVCDGQTGAAYGLCNAFCEAMDCDSDAPQASQTACDKVGAKFLRITGQVPPCVLPACPCVAGVPDFIEALNGEFGLTACQERDFTHSVSVQLNTGDGRSAYSQSGFNNGCGFLFPPGPTLFISQAEAEACATLIREKAAEAGLTCMP